MQVVRSHVPKSGVSGWRREGSSAGVRESTGLGGRGPGVHGFMAGGPLGVREAQQGPGLGGGLGARH